MSLLFYLALFTALLWLIQPRLVDWGLAPWVTGFMIMLGMATGCYWLLLWLANAGWSPARYALGALGGVHWLFGPTQWWGKWFGFSRDKVAHAFLLLYNQVGVRASVVSTPDRLLMLLPRCLNRDTLQALRALQTRYGLTLVVAAGGTEARQAIVQYRPQGILAVACARDLLLGIRDLAGKFPVLSFINEMPEGPCKNTTVDLVEVEKAIQLFLAKKKTRGGTEK